MPSSNNSKNRAPFLSLQNATFLLGDRLVFRNLTWRMERGQQWAIIGPNGSGKSVLADALRGRVPLVGGELRYHFRLPPGLTSEETIGHVAFEDRKADLHGAVVQSRWTSFEEQASILVRDFLTYERVMDVNPYEVTSAHDVARPVFERRMSRAIRLLLLEDFLERRLLSLSNGERQRVQLARAIAQPLRLLILDEPYVGLDAATRKYFHGVLEHLLSTPLRVLLITTHLEELPRHITHLIRVEDCRVVAAGPRAKVLPSRPVPCSIRRRTAPSRGAPVRRDATGMVKLIELRDVIVRYGKRTILSGVNWTIHQGSSWVLLGPNGSGKTTLLSLIVGDNPQAYVNDVTIFGRRRGNGESIWQLKKWIGWVSPELQLHFDDTASVRQVVLSGFRDTIGIADNATSAQSSAARFWLRRFGLSEPADLPLFSLSAGLQRMALLARALVKRPRLLVLDEPCQGLDAAHRQLLIQTVDALIRSRTVTTIFVTHRSEEIPRSISQVLELSSEGRASSRSLGTAP